MSVCLEVKNLNYRFNGQQVLENIDMSIEAGDYVGLLGPNGGGKTTLIKMLLGILRPDSGEIKFFGQDLSTFKHKEKIGYVPQSINSTGLDFPATALEIVMSGFKQFFFSFNQANNKQKALEMMEMTKIISLQNKCLDQLSGGERQKVFITRSLVNEPKILILDEPTVAIDMQSKMVFYEFLRDLNQNQQITIILISHDIGAVSKEVSTIYFLNRSISCYHNIADFVKPTNLTKIYGQNVNLLSHHH